MASSRCHVCSRVNQFRGQHLPWTVSLVLALLAPAALAAVHVYWPASSGRAKAMCRAPELRRRRRTEATTVWPSLCHVMSGGGRPSASHGNVKGLSTAMIYSFGWGLMTGGTERYEVHVSS